MCDITPAMAEAVERWREVRTHVIRVMLSEASHKHLSLVSSLNKIIAEHDRLIETIKRLQSRIDKGESYGQAHGTAMDRAAGLALKREELPPLIRAQATITRYLTAELTALEITGVLHAT